MASSRSVDRIGGSGSTRVAALPTDDVPIFAVSITTSRWLSAAFVMCRHPLRMELPIELV